LQAFTDRLGIGGGEKGGKPDDAARRLGGRRPGGEWQTQGRHAGISHVRRLRRDGPGEKPERKSHPSRG
jgi:hypothetical protein